MRLSLSQFWWMSVSDNGTKPTGRPVGISCSGWAATYPHHTETGSPDLVWWKRCLDRLPPIPMPVGATTIQVAL